MVKDAEKLLASVVIHFYSIMPPMKLLMMGIQNANARIYAAGIRKKHRRFANRLSNVKESDNIYFEQLNA
jgi:hypothetical protein